jgi:hypothetical protein
VVVEAEGVTDGVVVTDVDGVGVGAVDDGVWVGVLVEVLERGDGVDGAVVAWVPRAGPTRLGPVTWWPPSISTIASALRAIHA